MSGIERHDAIVHNILTYYVSKDPFKKIYIGYDENVYPSGAMVIISPNHLNFRLICKNFNKIWKNYKVIGLSRRITSMSKIPPDIDRSIVMYKFFEKIQKHEYINFHEMPTIFYAIFNYCPLESLEILNGIMYKYSACFACNSGSFLSFISGLIYYKYGQQDNTRIVNEFIADTLLITDFNFVSAESILAIINDRSRVREIFALIVNKLNLVYIKLPMSDMSYIHRNMALRTSHIYLRLTTVYGDIIDSQIMELFNNILIDYKLFDALFVLPINTVIYANYLKRNCRRHRALMKIVKTDLSPMEWKTFLESYETISNIINTPECDCDSMNITLADMRDITRDFNEYVYEIIYLYVKMLGNMGKNANNAGHIVILMKELIKMDKNGEYVRLVCEELLCEKVIEILKSLEIIGDEHVSKNEHVYYIIRNSVERTNKIRNNVSGTGRKIINW